MMLEIKLWVNGMQRTLHIDERENLADVLRNSLGLTSVKKGCEVGECGACTVLIDGTAINSCMYLAVKADGAHILTTEGLSGDDGQLTFIQRIFIEEAAVQCGFCTPGLLMTAVEIVNSGKKYSRSELKKLISGHLCRCTGYANIANAMERIIVEAAQNTKETERLKKLVLLEM